MKNIKIYLAISLLAVLMLSLSACAEIPAEASGVNRDASSYARAAKDTSYTESNANNLVDSQTGNNSTQVALKYRGTVDAVTATTLTLSGQTFSVATTQDLTTLFTPGTAFEIQFRQNQDGSISIDQFKSWDGSVEYDVEFKGLVDSVTAGTITLNGETFTVANTEDLTTLFTPGEVYEIKYLFNTDGTISIIAFHSEGEDDENNEYDVEFKGMVEAVTPDTITLNGETFTVANTEDLTTLFTQGEVYEIKYLFNADGTISIVAFHSEGDDYDVEFKGLVEAVTADTITLNGETFTVANTEDLTTLFIPGEMYEIKYLFNEDGSITIVDFHFEDEDDDMDDDSSDDDWDDNNDDDSNNNDDDSNNNDDDHDNSNDDNNNNNNNDDDNDDDNSNSNNDN